MIGQLLNCNLATPVRRHGAAFTLIELMISMSIFSLVVIGLISVHVFGQRYDQLVMSKLGASDQSRRGFNKLVEDIRASKRYRVGNYSDPTFTPIANGSPQQGNAIRLNYTTSSNNFIYYYFKSDTKELWRRIDLQTPLLVAGSLTNVTTNSMTFRAENHRGTIQTDLTQKGVISALLEFAQYQYPLTQVGPGLRYDYYKMELRATPHVPDGP